MSLSSFFEYEFLQNALLASILVAISCGVIGPLVLANRLVSLVGGVAHAAYGGLGLALFFSLPLMLSSLSFSLVCALIIAYLSRVYAHKADAIIAVIWSFGMALGVLLSDLSPGSNTAVMSYLFGSVLAVESSDLWLMLASSIINIAFVLIFARQLASICIDANFAKVCGIKEGALYYALILLATAAIIISLRVVGLIMIMALLSIPSYIASMFCLHLITSMLFASLLAFIFCVGGLILSVQMDLSASACIILLACLAFILALVFRFLSKQTSV